LEAIVVKVLIFILVFFSLFFLSLHMYMLFLSSVMPHLICGCSSLFHHYSCLVPIFFTVC